MFTLVAALAVSSPASAQDPEPSHAHAALPGADSISARVELIADSLPPDTRAAVEAEVAHQLAVIASELGFRVAESEAAGLVLRVELGQPDHKNPVYVIYAAALHEGQLLERAEARTCFRCTPAELVADALELLPRAVSQAVALQPKTVEAPAPALTDSPNTDTLAPRTPKPGPASIAGISLTALGVVGSIMGGVLLARDPRSRPGDDLYLTTINYEPPGAALLGVGLTSIVAGTVLLAVDAWVLGPRRTRKSRASLRHVELATPGLTLAGRF
ncbi:hypothetical protein DB30_06238 [Enhygromyxa salina]|uniref:Uncharacterized protein n=1 Tax=Enhygromyxa salina TaxID=215803 RepID=A0A0C2CUY3_9BACT|nr:hypothetical protein DB30_06238 [Enhygromyxa salina]